MNAAAALDVTKPESANSIGADLAEQTTALAALTVPSISTVSDLEQAVADRHALAQMKRRVENYFEPLKSLAHRLHKSLCDRENDILKPLDTRDRAIRDAMSAFKADQDRLRYEQEREEQARRQREQEERAAFEAAALESSGQPELAAAVMEDAITAPPPVVALRDVTKDAGAKFTTRWKWRYTGGPVDVAKTSPALVARSMKMIPREYLKVDEVKVGAFVRAMKSSASIPGLEIYSVDEPVR